MSRFFDEVERELVRAAAARTQLAPRRRVVAMLLIPAVALGVAGTAAGATYLALRSSSIAPFAADSTTPAQRVQTGSSRVLALRAPDPAHGDAPWALRVSRSDAGLTCSTVGQERAGGFGLVGLDGRFRVLPEANADACSGGLLIGTRVFSAAKDADVRTVVYGVAGAGLQRVTVSLAAGVARTLRHTPEGGFLIAFRGYPEDIQPTVSLRRAGKTSSYSFARGGMVVPDPLGGRAWKLQVFAFGRKPRTPPPRLQPVCATFLTARAVPGEATVVSPPVCGYEPGRPGVRTRTLFFQTRRLSGNASGGEGPFVEHWNRHAPRTAVWGVARGAKHIVVRAPGVTRATAPLLSGAFLALLPADVDPAVVSVEVDGRRYGASFGTIDPKKALP